MKPSLGKMIRMGRVLDANRANNSKIQNSHIALTGHAKIAMPSNITIEGKANIEWVAALECKAMIANHNINSKFNYGNSVNCQCFISHKMEYSVYITES